MIAHTTQNFSKVCVVFFAAVLFPMTAGAGNAFDILGQAAGLLRQVTPAANSPATAAANQGSAQSSGLDWMQDYPRSQLRKDYSNPYDRAMMPMSMPAPGATSTRYQVPIEGRVSMRQYRHEANDSPLLIQRHYDNLFAQQGFERVLLCSKPCTNSGGAAHWMKMLDPGQAVDYFYFPDAPLVMIAYKQNAIAFVAVGKNPNLPYASFIKLVEGTITDQAAMDRWLATLKPVAVPVATAPAKTVPETVVLDRNTPFEPARVAPQAPVAPQNSPLPAVGSGIPDGGRGTPPAPNSPVAPTASSSTVEVIDGSQLAAHLANAKGLVVVQFSSSDPGCSFCVSSNPRFDTLAQAKASSARFLRVLWQPYTKVFDDPLGVQYNVTGLPFFITFKNGNAVKRVNGNYPAATLNQHLLQDVR